jgi:ankyrin repeat protein
MRLNELAISFLFAVIVVAPQQGLAQPRNLLASIREGDPGTVETLLRSGADPNTRDESGATALMHAAAFASADTMRLLLDAGADVRGVDRGGATPLMWATHDSAKVRLLLAHGADVNVARSDGVTALLSAALRGNAEVMRMLISAGADVRKGTVTAPWPMGLPQITLTTNDPAMREFVDRAEATPPKLAAWTPAPLTRWLLTGVFGWRPQPASTGAGVVKVLLDAGANPNESIPQLTLTVPALSRVAQLHDVETIRVLLDRGADPNVKGSRGLTPLMIAAATDPRSTMVRLLLDKGATVDARDENGHTALDWALRLGDTEASRVLRKVGAVQMASAAPLPTAVSSPRPARAAMEIALSRLQAAGPPFYNRTKCISCHNQSLPSVAVKLAEAKGVRVDRALASHPTRATLEVWARSRESMMLGNCSVFGFLGNVSYGLFGLAEERVPPNPVTDAVTLCLSGLQKPDGSWEGGDTRPPLSARNPIVYTALALRGLSAYAPPGRPHETTARTARALEFLRRSTPAETQDEVFKLLGLIWARGTAKEISDQTKRLLALQHEDGGWSQLDTMPADAYATGQVLYALQLAGVAASSAPYRKGTQYLLRTQLEDGSWYVRSRAIGFQPYVDSGFPHGPDQFISAAATAWAVMALSHAL